MYWVTTSGHDEDWFILARTSRSAEAFHVDYEGFNDGDATAELILTGVDIYDEIPRHAQLNELEHLGFTIIDTGDRFLRKVKMADRVFAEGSMESTIMTLHDDIFEGLGEGRPNGSKRRPGNK